MSARARAAELAAVRKTLRIERPAAEVFQRFTRGMGSWWPFATHSIGGKDVAELVFEERPGGRVFERLTDGSEHDWGRVIAWDPPHSFRMTWHPGRDPSSAQELEVRFVADAGGTLLELTHTLWERYGDNAHLARANYDSGWEVVLGRFGVPSYGAG